MTEATAFDEMFVRIKRQLLPYAKRMDIRTDTTGNYHLYITNEIELAGRKFNECYFSGVSIHKTMVSFYFFPVYTHPRAFTIPSPIKGNLKGKNCFNFKKLDREQEKAIGLLLQQGAELYAKENILVN